MVENGLVSLDVINRLDEQRNGDEETYSRLSELRRVTEDVYDRLSHLGVIPTRSGNYKLREYSPQITKQEGSS